MLVNATRHAFYIRVAFIVCFKLGFIIGSFSQINPGATCGGATSLTVNSTCTNNSFTVSSTTGDPASSCAAGLKKDGYYTFTATSSTTYIDWSYSKSMAVAIFDACSGTELACNTTGTFSFATTATSSYLVHVIHDAGGGSGSGNICIYESPTPSGHNLGDGDHNSCVDSIFDPGGPTGDYASSTDITETYCSDAGSCISVDFRAFHIESWDDLFIYDGTSTADPLIGNYAGTGLPNGGTIESSSGCLTFRFVSDGSVEYAGWSAALSCSPCPTCSDGIQNGLENGVDCGGPCTPCPGSTCATANTISTIPYTATSQSTSGFGDNYSSTDACGSSYMNGDDYVMTYTPPFDTCVDITLSNVSSSWAGLFLLDGCPDAGGTNCVAEAEGGTAPEISRISLISGTTYYIIVSTSPSPQTVDFDIAITGCLPVVGHTIGSGDLNTCLDTVYDSGGKHLDYTNNEDRTETYCSSAGNCIQVDFDAFQLEGADDLYIYDGTSTADYLIGIYNGSTVPNGGVTIKSTTGCLTFRFDSDGSVIYSGWEAPLSCDVCPTCSDGIRNGHELGVDCGGPTCTPCPGSTCGTAQTVSGLPYVANNITTNGYADDYDDTDACGSIYMNGDDYVLTYTPPFDTCIDILMSNTNTTWGGLFLLDGCPDAGGTTCVAEVEGGSDPTITGASLTSGTTYYIVISTYPSPQTVDFDLTIRGCLHPPPCGVNDDAHDDCDMATYINNLNGYCGNTSSSYTSGDIPSVFCGTIENNSWLVFTADSTAAVINAFVSNCSSGSGIQIEIYETSDCNTFTSVSNCWNPANEENGTITATGLTPGNDYYIMIDGNSGDVCDYTIGASVGVSVPLGITSFAGFRAKCVDDGVRLSWSAKSSDSQGSIVLERKLKGGEFQNLYTMNQSKGQSQHRFTDLYLDSDVLYRLKLIDKYGRFSYSDVVSVPCKSNYGSVEFFPNPVRNQLHVRGVSSNLYKFRCLDLHGRELSVPLQGNSDHLILDLSKLENGVYFIEVQTENRIYREKVILNH